MMAPHFPSGTTRANSVASLLSLAVAIGGAVLLASLCACQPNSRTEVIREGAPKPIDTKPTDRMGYGTVDSGGANGVGGRMLDSYQVNLRDSKIFAEKVLPIIVKLADSSPRFASDLVHIAVDRIWYFIPGDLDVLPSEVIGAHLSTEQYALQNRQEVWVDERRYEGLKSDDERATLLLHEFVMGVRLMAFQNDYDECLSRVAILAITAKDFDDYRHARSQCSQSGSYIPGGGPLERPLKLNKEDYAAVRELTMMLWRSGGAIAGDELRNWLKVRSFRSASVDETKSDSDHGGLGRRGSVR